MPYGISQNQPDCSRWAAVVQREDGSFETLACYDTKQDAIDRMVAQSLAEDLEPMGEVGNEPEEERSGVEERQISLIAPDFMAASARRGLRLHEEGFSGDGLVPAVPEPSTWMMLLLGFFMLGSVLRHRNKATRGHFAHVHSGL